MFKYATAVLYFSCIAQAGAFPCFITLLKDSCWKDYEVNVVVKDAVHDKVETKLSIPKNQLWAREKFDCTPKEELSFIAQFSPTIWKGDENKEYAAVHDWFLPETIKPNTTAWNVNICFPKDFADVPLPPGDLINCGCSKNGVPDIPPQT